MNDWMDDLSEDWVSQPRSEDNSSAHSQLGDSRRRSVLSERSNNSANIQANSVQRPRKGLSRRSLSDASTGSQNRYDTTARKSVSVSPPKQRLPDNTPEWRRRLLQGEMAVGEQKDLFSPMAIEGIFQKPAPRGSLRQTQSDKPRGLSFLKRFEQQVPSSPPPWPPLSAPVPKAPSRFGTMNGRPLDDLAEVDEDSRQSMMQEEQSEEEQSRPESAAPSNATSSRSASNGSVVHKQVAASRKASLSSVRFHPDSRKPSENASWNMTQNSDDFSPVFISKHNTADGRIAYAPLDMSKSELQEQLRKLRGSQPSTSQDHSTATRSGDESSIARLESENLPEDLAVGTPDVTDVASLGEFVERKRGGYSEIGSFRRRPLSPSPLRRPISASVDDTSMMQNNVADLDYSGIPPSVPTPPPAPPKTPQTNRTAQLLSPERAKSSNSPLKLFGNHDTFTANRLQRRISQLEDPEAEGLTENKGSPSRRVTGEDLSAVEEASFVEDQRRTLIAQHFGQGHFDEHSFPEDQFSPPPSSRASRELPSRSPSPDMMPPGYHEPFRFHVDEPPAEFIDTFRSRRKPSTQGQLSISKRSDRSRPKLDVITADRVTSQPSQISQVSEGKRPLTPSPFKSPTPKRRRTVFSREFAEANDEVEAGSLTLEVHNNMQSALNRKRKDARHGSERNLADADVLAQRSILRPRNPTPSQRRREEAERAVFEAHIQEPSSDGLEAIQDLSMSAIPGETTEAFQTRVVATHLAVLSEDVAQRKKSVTTQDYLDHAMKVMNAIRASGRPNSGLTSVVEQDSELPEEPERWEDSIGLSLERPPTREGKRSGWRSRGDDRIDPRVISHLRKFQEDESEAFMDTVRSVIESRTSRHIETIESDPPGIQIFDQRPRDMDRSRTRSDSHRSQKAVDSTGSNGTHGTTATTSSRTSVDSTMGNTTNSRKSENVATLAPDAVAHLIPEQVAGMTFDKETQKWVKQRSPKKEKKISNDHSAMSGSDNDPFGDIPDLTVDSVEETKHLLLSKSAGRHAIGVPPEGASALFNDFSSRPSTSGNEGITSLLNGSPTKKPSPKNRSSLDVPASAAPLPAPPPVETSDEVEHEISIHEGRSLPPRRVSEVRNIQVSLSSPVWHRTTKGLSPVLESPGVSTKDYGFKPPQATPAFQRQDRQLSLSVRVSGAVARKREGQEITQIQDTPCKSDVTFYLSELPEFTLNEVDEREIQARELSKHNTVGPFFHGAEDRYASGNHFLVKALQDLHPEEPYWEDLRKVDLHGKGLTSLHLLDMFCEKLEKADVSRNALSQLNGAPHGIRALSAHHNTLTSLTSWGHLGNLQYLDVSHNQIDSLQGFASLIHLRELRVEGNQIESLDGIEGLDGLLHLSLRDNQLKEVDFEGCELHRLETLDLGGNDLTVIRGLHCLPSLKESILDSNNITLFPQGDHPCPQLLRLDLSKNELADIELGTFCPKLQRLALDGNQLETTAGICQLRHLESLSMRSQTPVEGSCDLSSLLEAHLPNLRSLALSENHIHVLDLPHDWYSLRTLELASCGLQDLPQDFGQSVPSLRWLNLNFNAIKDLRPLLNIKSLSQLHIAGNRVSRLRKTMAVLGKLRKLEVLDLRDNPFSIGFYPKAVESRLVSTSQSLDEVEGKYHLSKKDGGGEEMRFALPPLDKDQDASYFARLDEGTKLRRRVYEMLLGNSCMELSELDGMAFRREDVMVRDDIWDRLVLLGVVRKSGKVVEDEEEVISPLAG